MSSQPLPAGAARKAAVAMMVATLLYVWALAASLGVGTGLASLAHLLGFGGARQGTVVGWVLAGVVTVLFCVATMRRFPLIRQNVFRWSALKALSLPFGVLAGIMEELWFRRVPMDWAAAHGATVVTQVALSALLFGAIHGVWGLLARRAQVAVGAAAATALLGAALGIVYVASGRVLAPCVWSHAVINVVLEPWLLLAAMSPRPPRAHVLAPATDQARHSRARAQ
jgi:CAAX protease family protein